MGFLSDLLTVPWYRQAHSPQRGKTDPQPPQDRYFTIEVTSSNPRLLTSLRVDAHKREVCQRKGAKRPSMRYRGDFGFWFADDATLTGPFIARLKATPGITSANLRMRWHIRPAGAVGDPPMP